MADRKTMLVVGATGVIGRYLLRHLDGLDDWDAIAVARRPPRDETRAQYISVDLSDKADCRAKLGGLTELSHMVYAAYTDRPSWAEQCAPNAAMLANALNAIEPVAAGLRRVVLMQGTKYYGCHLGPFKTPAKEDDQRHMPPNFYFNQQDLLTARQPGTRWSWTCLRPHTVGGFALDMPLNLISVIGVYATISKALGLPLRFPGKPGAYRRVFQMTDADLLARAIVWSAEAPDAANQAYNITNGDYFRWEHMWPRIAAYFDMPAGPVQQIDLARFMADKAPLWDRIVSDHGLVPTPFEKAANWPFGNYIFGCDWDILSDTLKARHAGFHDCIESETMFMRLLDQLRTARFIP